MSRRPLLLFLAAALAVACPLAGSTLPSEQTLISSLKDETALLPPQAQGKARQLYPKLVSNDPDSVDLAIAALRDVGKADGRFLSILNALSTTVVARRAADVQLASLEERLKKTFDTAKSPGELDPLIAAIDGAKDKADAIPSAPGLSSTLEILSTLAEKWQAYLAMVQSSNPAGANQILNDLANDPVANLYYPRPRILERQMARMAQTPGPDLDPVKTYRLIEPQRLDADNLDELISEMRDADVHDVPMMEDLSEGLDLLRQETIQLALGSGQRALSDSAYFEEQSHHFGPYSNRLREIYHDLKLRAVAVEVQAGPSLQPQPAEETEAYLLRILLANKTAKNWDQVSRAVDVSHFAVSEDLLTEPSPLTHALTGYRYFLAGRRYEARGDWQLAARAYQDALGIAEPTLPTDSFKDSLRALGSAHPTELGQATGPDPGGFQEEIQAGGLYLPRRQP